MRVVFDPAAQAEFNAVQQQYELKNAGLGQEFAESVRQGLRRVLAQPLSCPIEVSVFRRLVLKRFPYKVMYSVEVDCVYVVAIAHQRREQTYWYSRITDQ